MPSRKELRLRASVVRDKLRHFNWAVTHHTPSRGAAYWVYLSPSGDRYRSLTKAHTALQEWQDSVGQEE